MKRCTKCGLDKELGDFYGDKSKKDHLTLACKACLYTPHKRKLKYLLICSTCKIAQPRTNYYGNPNKPLKGNNRCKECERIRGKTRKRSSSSQAVNASKHLKRRAAGPVSSSILRQHREMYPDCAKCGSPNNLEYDHIQPVAKGGTNDFWNLQTLCRSCNGQKGATYANYLYKALWTVSD